MLTLLKFIKYLLHPGHYVDLTFVIVSGTKGSRQHLLTTFFFQKKKLTYHNVQRVRDLGTLGPYRMFASNSSPQASVNYVEDEAERL